MGIKIKKSNRWIANATARITSIAVIALLFIGALTILPSFTTAIVHAAGCPEEFHSLTIDPQNGDASTSSCQRRGIRIVFPQPTRTGYALTAWNTVPAGGGTDYGVDDPSPVMGMSDITYYAQWVGLVTISFDGQGGTAQAPIVGIPNSTKDINNVPVSDITIVGSTRDGYTFAGWNTKANGSGETYGTYFSGMPATDMTIYAQWQSNTPVSNYTLSYNTQGGSKPESLNDTLHAVGNNVTLGTTTRDGYTLTGWNTAADGSGTTYAAGSTYSMPGVSTTLYAMWTAVSAPSSNPSIPNGGDVNGDDTIDSSQTNVSSLINPVTNQYAAISVSNSACTLSDVSANSVAKGADGSYSYPMGLANFTATCGTPGFTTTVTQDYYNPPAGNFVLRKFINGKYVNVSGATISRITIGGQPVLRVTYQVTDGGALDADGTVNGVIVDPAGPALAPVANTPDTGYGAPSQDNSFVIATLASAVVLVGAGLALKYRQKHSS